MKIKAIIFDLDGTLANTIKDLANATDYALSTVGLPGYTTEEYKHFVGNGNIKLIERALGENFTKENFEEVMREFSKYYSAHSNDFTCPYEGMDELLDYLSQKGYKTAVLSNKNHNFVPPLLSDLYPNHKFTLAWGKKDEFPTKPAPDALNAMVKELGVKKEECIFVGDSNVDVQTGKNAGITVCGVTWGFRGYQELKSEGADIIVDTPKEIIEEFAL